MNGEIWSISYANNVYASIILIPVMFLNGELGVLMKYAGFFEVNIWFVILIGGICGFMIGFFTTMQIKVSMLKNNEGYYNRNNGEI